MNDFVKKTLNDMPYWERLHNNPSDDSLIVFTFHWMTGTATAMPFLFDDVTFPMREIALQGTYPSGYPEDGGFSWFEREADFYEVLSEAEQAPLILQEVTKIADFIKAMRDQYTGQVIAIGMSQGGDITLHLAVHYPDLLDLACAMAGRLSEPMRPKTIDAKPLPKVVMLLGADDHIVSVKSSEAVKDWLTDNNFTVTLTVYDDVGHNISMDMVSDSRKAIQKL